MDIWAIIAVVVAAVGIIIGFLQWKFSNATRAGANIQKIHDAHERIKLYDERAVECEKRFVQLEERKTDNKSIEEIRTDISYIKGALSAVFSSNGTADILVQSKSPISLTDAGKQLAETMALPERISNNNSKIYSFLEANLESKNAYDIQQFCIETASVYPERFFNDDDVEFIKNFAYNNGRPLAYYGSMIGIMIRDAYLKYKNIDVAEIDKHDPQIKAAPRDS